MPSYGADSLARDAARASTERYAKGQERGLLDGVPFGVKDDLDVEGYVCHFGMQYDEKNPFFKKSEKSIWAVKKMEEAGAVMVGKLAMHELGVGEFCSRLPGSVMELLTWHRHERLQCKHLLSEIDVSRC